MDNNNVMKWMYVINSSIYSLSYIGSMCFSNASSVVGISYIYDINLIYTYICPCTKSEIASTSYTFSGFLIFYIHILILLKKVFFVLCVLPTKS